MKIQNKIALIFTALSAGIILALSVFVYFFASENIATSFFHRLEVRSDIVGHAALQDNKSLSSIYYDIKERHLGSLPYEKHRILPGQPAARDVRISGAYLSGTTGLRGVRSTL